MDGCAGDWASDGVAGATGVDMIAGMDGCEYWRRVYEIAGFGSCYNYQQVCESITATNFFWSRQMLCRHNKLESVAGERDVDQVKVL